MNKKKLSIVQMAITPGKPEINRKRAAKLIEKAAEEKPDIIMLPEMWTTAYELEHIRDICDREGLPTLDMIKELAAKYQVNIIAGSFANMIEGKVKNSAYIINRQGEEVARYDKIHLFKLMDEDKHISPGSQVCLFELEGIRCGLIICYDLRFPELARKLALLGIQVLFVPAQWPGARIEHWRTLLKARAIENQIFVAANNRAGEHEKDTFIGGAMLLNPWGEVLQEGDFREQILTDIIDLDLIDDVKSKINVYIDRVPALY